MLLQDPTKAESSEKTADTDQSILRRLGELLDTGLELRESIGTEPPSPDSTGGWAFDGLGAGATTGEHGAQVRCLLVNVF